MKLTATKIAGLWITESERRSDERGSFMRLYCGPTLAAAGLANHTPVQINHSVNRLQGTLRGIHYQGGPSPESKIVRCLKGRILDVIVDIRTGSSTFLKHEKIELSADNGRAVIVPPGCAHGFQTLEDDCELIYLHSAAYDPIHEGGLRHDDPRLHLNWPLPVTVLSDRDKNFPFIPDDFSGVAHAV